MHCYLLVRLVRPFLLVGKVTKLLHLFQHGRHEGGPQLPCICAYPLSSNVLTFPHVEVESRERIKKLTATIHVPVYARCCKIKHQFQHYESYASVCIMQFEAMFT